MLSVPEANLLISSNFFPEFHSDLADWLYSIACRKQHSTPLASVTCLPHCPCPPGNAFTHSVFPSVVQGNDTTIQIQFQTWMPFLCCSYFLVFSSMCNQYFL